MNKEDNIVQKTISQFGALKAGESMVYHTGFVALERDEKTTAAECISKIANFFISADDEQRCYLTQKRLAKYVYEYTATKPA